MKIIANHFSVELALRTRCFFVWATFRCFRHIRIGHHYDLFKTPTWSLRQAAIAGVTRSVLWILAKL